MQPDDVRAEAGERCSPHRQILFRRNFHRAAAPVREVNSPEADAFAIRLHQVAAPDAYEAVLAGRAVGKKRKIGGRRSGRAMIHRERLQKLVVPLGESHAREEPRCQRPSTQPAHLFTHLSLAFGILLSEQHSNWPTPLPAAAWRPGMRWRHSPLPAPGRRPPPGSRRLAAPPARWPYTGR